MRARSKGVNFPRTMARFSYSDARKRMTPETIARIATRFHLPAERTKVQSDFHYKSITIMLASIDRGRVYAPEQ